jgi:hypothetical protein
MAGTRRGGREQGKNDPIDALAVARAAARTQPASGIALRIRRRIVDQAVRTSARQASAPLIAILFSIGMVSGKSNPVGRANPFE